MTDRAFDDDRWPDEDLKACCFLCGRPVDPRDPGRGSYSPKPAACGFLPIHLSCAEPYANWSGGKCPKQMEVAAMKALMQMGEANARRAREAARCSIVSPTGT